MPTSGRDLYDDPSFFARYTELRERADTANDTMEGPAVRALVGDVRGASILDLGCGDGRFGAELLAAGAIGYVGVDASARMLEVARQNLGERGTLVHAALEDWDPGARTYDVVVSRLALHYVDDVGRVLSRVAEVLRTDGRLVFSVEHPILTSSDRAVAEGRADWVVDDYFRTGRRVSRWLGVDAEKVHRTLEDWFAVVRAAGFVVQDIREARPVRERFTDPATYERRLRVPLFLVIAASRRR